MQGCDCVHRFARRRLVHDTPLRGCRLQLVTRRTAAASDGRRVAQEGPRSVAARPFTCSAARSTAAAKLLYLAFEGERPCNSASPFWQ